MPQLPGEIINNLIHALHNLGFEVDYGEFTVEVGGHEVWMEDVYDLGFPEVLRQLLNDSKEFARRNVGKARRIKRKKDHPKQMHLFGDD